MICTSFLFSQISLAQTTDSSYEEVIDYSNFGDAGGVKRYATQKTINQTPNRVVSIGYEYQSAFDLKNKGADLKTNSEIKEIYAAGIGLVFIEKKVGATYYRNRLNRRISPDEFLKIQIQNK